MCEEEPDLHDHTNHEVVIVANDGLTSLYCISCDENIYTTTYIM